MRWLDVAQPYTLDHATSFVSRVDDDWSERRGAHFVIDRDGDLVGYLGVLAVEADMSVVEIMYWVVAAHRGDALARRALQLALPWIGEAIGPTRVELGMKAGNAGSARTAEGAGFTLAHVAEGAAELDGSPVDEHIYARRIAFDTTR